MQGFAGESPVAIIFEPRFEPVAVGSRLETTHVIARDQVGDQPTPVPQEAVGLFARGNDAPAQAGEPGHWIIAVGVAEDVAHSVGPVCGPTS